MISLLLVAVFGASETMPPSRSAAELAPEIVIIARTKKVTFSGYFFDGCRDGKLVKDGSEVDRTPVSKGGMDCFSVGGVIYAAPLTDVEVVRGPSGIRIRRVGIVDYGSLSTEHASRRKWFLVLRPAPAELQEATGIEYLSVNHGTFDERTCPRRRLAGAERDCYSLDELHSIYSRPMIPTTPSPTEPAHR